MSTPCYVSPLDQIIADALKKAQEEAIGAVFQRYGNHEDSEITKALREHVLAYLKSDEGQERIRALCEKAIAGLTEQSVRRW